MMKTGAFIHAVVLFLLFAAGAATCGPGPATGSFDIEKVRQAAMGAGDHFTDSGEASAAAMPAGKSEWVGWIAARVCLYLALIAAVIVLLAWLIKRFGLVGRSKISGGSMDLLETLPLGPQRAILMVRIKDAVFVLGQTQQQITLLDKVEGQEALDLISSSKGGLSVTQFKDAFDGFMGKIRKPF
jgi:flagellar biosynthetic protein FliO